MYQFLLILFFLIVCFGVSTPINSSRIPKRNDKQILIFCLICFGILSAFRTENVGNDTQEYIRIFESCRDMIKGGVRYENGYLYYNYLIYNISHNSQFFLLVSSALIYTVYGYFIWKYSKRPIIALIFFFLIAYCDTLNTMRQSLAICILLFGVECLINNRRLLFVLTIALASFFHTSSLLFIFVLPLSYFSINKKNILIFIGVSLLGYISFSSLINLGFSYFSIYEDYAGSKYFEGDTRIASYINLFLLIIVFIVAYIPYRRNKDITWQSSVEGRRYSMLLLLELIAIMVSILSLKVNLFDRLVLYFSALSFVLIANAICLYPSRQRKAIFFFLISLYTIYNSIVIIFRPDWNRVFPIDLYWNF